MTEKETKTTTSKAVSKSTDDKTPADSAKEAEVDIKTTSIKDEKPIDSTTDKLPSEKDTPISAPTTPEASTDSTLITEPAADAAPAATNQTTPSDPVVVSEKEVNNEDTASGGGKLADEIEILTGEIQALEAKIEQLTDGATSAPAEVESAADVAPINESQAPQAPVVKEEKKDEAPKLPEPVKTEKSPDSSEKDFVNKPQKAPDPPTSAVAGAKSPNKFSDISAKAKPNETPKDLNPSNEDTNSGNSSGLAIIGEVIAVFGVIIFIILAISPFFKEIVGTDTYQAIQQIGWLAAIGSLGVGLILYMFVKGSILFKTLIFLLLLMASVLFLAINENSLLSPILGTLEPLLDFYR